MREINSFKLLMALTVLAILWACSFLVHASFQVAQANASMQSGTSRTQRIERAIRQADLGEDIDGGEAEPHR